MIRSTFFISASLLALAAGPALAAADATKVEELTVTGSRTKPRSTLESLQPIDSISSETISRTGSADLIETLSALIPSFTTQRLPALDGAMFVRPARLRNLSPDQTLVLLNGKRMHRSAMMMNPSYGSSFQAPDLSQVAPSAIRSIEVLRDGAAAQYGSDAIAGVINIRLEDRPGYEGFAQWGQYFEGDGAGPRLGGRAGWASGDSFLTVSAEYSDTGATSRSQQQAFAAAFQAARPDLKIPNPAVRWGQPDRKATRLAFNSAIDLDVAEGYAFGTWGKGWGVGDFNYRSPYGAIIAPTNTFSAGFSAQFLPNAAFPGFTALQAHPTGFTPRFGQDDRDLSLVGGLRTTFGNDLKLDASLNYGRNRIDYFMKESFNFSLGPASPTSFDDGGVQQTEFSVNLDGSLPLRLPVLAEPAILAFGLEDRSETYRIRPGDPASYAIGPGAPALSVGSAGFIGYSPVQAGKRSQHSSAAYLDVFLPATESLEVDLAVRFENFNTFGSATTGKISARWELADFLAVRGSASSGFRAPTPAQLYSEALSQFLNPAVGVVTTGRFSPAGPVASILNKRDGVKIRPLEPETSRNYSLGLVSTPVEGLSLTLDFFQIEIRKRLNGSVAYALTPAENAALNALNIPNLQAISSATFLQNDFDTTTKGYEFVGAYGTDLGGGRLSSSLALSSIETEITKARASAVLGVPAAIVEKAYPRYRGTGILTYDLLPFSVSAKVRYYGSWTDSVFQGSWITQEISPLTMVDLEGSWAVTRTLKIRAGVENIFDAYPDEAKLQTYRGLLYSRNSPYNTDGGYYFIRAEVQF
ncbi:MAG: TonB-dependent receptor plug domain-containing protein [Phenylobacterium sp.]